MALYKISAPKIIDYLSDESKAHQEELINLLNYFEIPFVHNQSLVRGLDYYTKTVFEIKTLDSSLGVQNTICAGGRYDNLVQEFGGSATPAFGWALGMERLMLLLNQNSPENYLLDFAIIYAKDCFNEAFALASNLRQKGFKTVLEYEGFETRSQSNKMFEKAQKTKAQNIIFYKPDENTFVELKNNLNNQKIIYKTNQEFWENISKEISN